MRVFSVAIPKVTAEKTPETIFDALGNEGDDAGLQESGGSIDWLDVGEASFTTGRTHLRQGIVRFFRETAAGEAHRLQRGQWDESVEDRVLCILAVPSFMTPAEFLTFIGMDRESLSSSPPITHVRLVRESLSDRYMALLRFRSASDATDFLRYFNGRRFSELEVVFIENDEEPLFPDSQIAKTSATPLFSELPTCPVCLERLDSTVTGLATTACRHTFHCNCLSGWEDGRCPVCRYSLAPITGATNNAVSAASHVCNDCLATSHLWTCLICGHLGCGRYESAHAYNHFVYTGHAYALEIESQRIWDYSGDSYVHRLIRDKVNGHLVEIPNPSDPDSFGYELDEKTSKIELEYAQLISSQLDTQRTYYEMELERAYAELSLVRAELDELKSRTNHHMEAESALQERFRTVVADLERERILVRVAEKRRERAEQKLAESLRQLDEEKSLASAVRENHDILQQQVQRQAAEIQELQEQVRDLAFALDARDKVQSGEFGQEAVGGTLEVRPSKARRDKKSRR